MSHDMTLPELLAELLRREVMASRRGNGAAEYVFAEHLGKAVEISKHQDQWWVEFWNATPDKDSPPVKEMFFWSPVEALQEVLGWLQC
jgi:hypothetical protein